MIQHVALEVLCSDVEAEAAFWTRLGFTRVPAPGALRERSTWLEDRAGAQVHLVHADEPVVPPSGHLALLRADLDALVEALRGAGVEVSEREPHWGARRVFVRTPAGHRVELMAAPPA